MIDMNRLVGGVGGGGGKVGDGEVVIRVDGVDEGEG